LCDAALLLLDYPRTFDPCDGKATAANARSSIVAKRSHKRAKSAAAPRRRPRRAVVSPSPDELFDQMGTSTLLANNRSIFKQGAPAEYLYKVESGCVRTCSNLDGSRRRIHAFYFPGEYFGLETSEGHSVFAETVVPSELRLVKRQTLAVRAAHDIDIVHVLLHITIKELQRIRNHNLLLFKRVHERLFGFLCEIHRHNPSKREIDLPMTRSDIADYLDLTIETVSRALTRLKNTSAISMLSNRRVVLSGPAARN
jgi:CRP/FNR family transcriptional regulator, nitrogen fixation regulation protein